MFVPTDAEYLVCNHVSLEDNESNDSKEFNSISLLLALDSVTNNHGLFHFDSYSADLCMDTCTTKGLRVFK